MMTSSKSLSRQGSVRRSIASLAARLMAEDGIADYGHAKRKAARQLGVPAGEALPNNVEIEAELRAYQSLYQGDEQRERLRHLRGAALKAMRLLQDFRPYLTGQVLDGTAGRYASVQLEAYTESSKEIEIFLVNQNIAYDFAEGRRSAHHSPETILAFEYADAPIRLAVFNSTAERRQRRPVRNGKGAERARMEAVEALLLEDTR